MTTEPKIFTKNYVSADDVFTISHGPTAAPYLYDRDNLSKWQSSGANDDDVTVSLVVEFYEGSVAINRTIDTFMLLNHNLKTWDLYYWDGDSWESLASESADAAVNTIKTFTEVTTSKIMLEVSATQVVDAEKYIGEMIACALKLNIGLDLGDVNNTPRQKVKVLTMGDGSIQQMITKFSPNRIDKYGCQAPLECASETLRDDLEEIHNEGAPFLWQPESVTRPADVFLVHWDGPFVAKYENSYKGSGYRVMLNFKEV